MKPTLPTTPAAATSTRPTSPVSTASASRLASPDDHVVLPEIISKEPLGPAVRQGDDKWNDIVKWTYFALLNTEELGITKANVEEMKTSANPGDQAHTRRRGRDQDRYGSRTYQ